MAVLRKEKHGNFTVIDNGIFKDYNLSLKAKGLLCMMLSLPDGWSFSIVGLSRCCKDGKDSVASTLKELEQAGYFKRKQKKVNGKFKGVEYVVYEQKSADLSDTENPYTGNPITENPPQLNTNILNTEKSKTKELNSCRSVLAMMTEEESTKLFSIYEDADLLIDAVDEELKLKNKFNEIQNAYRYVIGYAENKKWSKLQT